MRMLVSDTLSVRKIDDEVFVYDRGRSYIHTFNSTGAYIWNRIESGADERQIIEGLISDFDVDEGAAEKDFNEFIAMLSQSGLISIF